MEISLKGWSGMEMTYPGRFAGTVCVTGGAWMWLLGTGFGVVLLLGDGGIKFSSSFDDSVVSRISNA